MENIPLSVLDQSPIRSGGSAADAINETIELAQLTENLGFSRFGYLSTTLPKAWRDALQRFYLLGWAQKPILFALVQGVMLPHYSPYKVAENFKLLETMYPGRIDLGVGRAPGSDQFIASVLRYGSHIGPEYFPNKVADLDALLRDAPPPTEGMERAIACPPVDIPPQLWMLGSSEDSAMLAGAMGLPYSFAFFINAQIRPDILNVYRQRFKASAVADKPYASLGVFVICADTEEEAIHLSRSRDLWYVRFTSSPKGPTVPTPEEAEAFPYTEQQLAFLEQSRKQRVVGTPEQVREKLEAMVEKFEADELVIVTITHSFAARCKSYELLADAWGM